MRALRVIVVGLIASLLGPGSLGAQESLDALLDKVKKSRVENQAINRQREAEFRTKKSDQQRLLREAQGTRDRLERRSEQLEASFNENELRIISLEEQLRNRLGNLGELFGVVRQVAGDTRGVLDGSLASAQFPGRAEPMAELAESKVLPSIRELEGLWFTLLQEMVESGKVVRFDTTVVLPDGEQVQREVVRVGVFNAVSGGKFLQYLPGTGKLTELPRQPAGRYRGAAQDLEDATEGMVAMAVDPSRGSILSLLVQAPTYTERVQQGGLIGYITIALGLFGLGIVVVRFRVLWNTGRAMKAQESSDKADPGNPLGRVMQVYEEYGTADTETLELKLDESILKDAPQLERGLTTVKVLSIIAPLLGLLGTVTGMILTFQQITLFGTGDPKMMAGGISQALVTTMIGLSVAIPLTLLHSWLRDRSKGLIQILEEESAGMVARRAEAEHAQ
ncbi:MAG: MotA/TolQ/ExbB proton channel family protein [Myxococcota bacterium]